MNILFAILTLTCLVCHSDCVPLARPSTSDNYHEAGHARIYDFQPKPLTVGGPISYQPGLNLTCYAKGIDVDWRWLRNGVDQSGILRIHEDAVDPKRQSSMIWLGPTDDPESNYTCMAVAPDSNITATFEGGAVSVSHTFKVVQHQQHLPHQGKHDEWLWLVVTIPISLVVMVIIVAFLSVFFWRRLPPKLDKPHIKAFYKGSGGEGDVPLQEGQGSVVEPYATFEYDMSTEIKKASLKFGKILNSGQFGEVRAGTLLFKRTGSYMSVAIKYMKDKKGSSKTEMDSVFLDFLNEIKLMGYLGHHRNVVGYVGAVTKDIAIYSVYLVVEYCGGGNLLTCLRTHHSQNTFKDDIKNCQSLRARNTSESVLTTSTLTRWAEEIATGMDYISSKRLIHRDLAARNVLLAWEGINSESDGASDPSLFTAKISDLGISRNLNESQTYSNYYQIVNDTNSPRSPPVLPLRWLSIEALESLKFSSKSDVWSMGVTFWEMFSLGGTPYQDEVPGDLPHSQQRFQLINHLKFGSFVSEPDHVPPVVWELMMQCWELDPKQRPTFKDVKKELHQFNDEIQNQLQQKQKQPSPSSSAAPAGIMAEYSQFEILQGPL